MKFIFAFLLAALAADVAMGQVWSGSDGSSATSRTGTVAIGFSTSPLGAAKLDVRGGAINAVNTASSPYLFLARDADPGNNDSYFYHRITSNYHLLGSNKNGIGSLRKLGFAIGGGDVESDVKMTIDGAGNVGIGTGSPAFQMHLKDATGGAALGLERNGKLWRFDVDYTNAQILYIGHTDRSNVLTLNKNGNIGIGTYQPASQLHLSSDADHALTLSRANGTYGFRIMRNAGEGNVYFQIATAAGTSWETKIKIGEGEGANTRLLLNPDGGNVGIGTLTPDKALTVKGTIHTNEVLVDMNAPIQGPDYVFEKDYNLLPLAEVESYIKENKHLPEVPSAKEMEEEGLNLKEMNLLLLRKIEEMTLHLIEQNKVIAELKERSVSADSSAKKVEELTMQVTELNKRLSTNVRHLWN